MRTRPNPAIVELLAKAKPMTDEQRERQLVSLAYGNARLENDRVERASVEAAVRATRPQRPAR